MATAKSFPAEDETMMRKAISAALSMVIALAVCAPSLAYNLQYRDNFGLAPRRWVANPIIIAFSSSLSSPPSNIKAGSDVIGAARRALQHWSSVANIHFLETSSPAQTISPQNLRDGVSLITVSPDNAAVFGASESPGRTRVFYDPSGVIVEADVALNPSQSFSSDGTPGTYDLESTFTHEVGHLLGLEHSAIIGATMQPRQAKNGLFNLPALTQRTLSEDDCAGARALYGSPNKTGSIAGKVIANASASGSRQNVFGAHVFAENPETGKVMAGNITTEAGEYHLDGLAPSEYRLVAESLDGPITAADIAPSGVSPGPTMTMSLFRAFNAISTFQPRFARATVNAANAAELIVPSDLAPTLRPKVLGLNGELSTVALPLEAGKTSTIYVGGEGVDQIPADGISISSPFMKVDPATLASAQFNMPYPVIGFDVTVAPNAQAGDYSLRLQLASGELAYLAGALTIDPGVDASAFANAADDPQFFVRQQYRDFLGREPDSGGLEYWTSQLTQCSSDSACLRARRIDVSAAFFDGEEFQKTGSFVYGLYKSALARPPTFAEFSKDRSQVVGGENLDSEWQSLALAFVQRPEFIEKYPAGMSAEEFTDAFIRSVKQSSNVDLSNHRDSFIASYDGLATGRAAILQQAAGDAEFIGAERNRAFVLMQYFGYLRRDADRGGYDFWLNALNAKVADRGAYRRMVCAFLTSAEYQLRFSINATRTNSECGQ
jgi:Matrixin/Domain of unknown function (DUF4214)